MLNYSCAYVGKDEKHSVILTFQRSGKIHAFVGIGRGIYFYFNDIDYSVEGDQVTIYTQVISVGMRIKKSIEPEPADILPDKLLWHAKSGDIALFPIKCDTAVVEKGIPDKENEQITDRDVIDLFDDVLETAGLLDDDTEEDGDEDSAAENPAPAKNEKPSRNNGHQHFLYVFAVRQDVPAPAGTVYTDTVAGLTATGEAYILPSFATTQSENISWEERFAQIKEVADMEHFIYSGDCEAAFSAVFPEASYYKSLPFTAPNRAAAKKFNIDFSNEVSHFWYDNKNARDPGAALSELTAHFDAFFAEKSYV